MSVLTRPRHPTIDTALELARTWCAGHVIDDAPALGHAVRVALTLDRHLPDASPELIAAALLHDSPEFAPANLTLDELLTARFGPAVTRVVRALEAEHVGLDTILGGPPIPIEDPWVLYAGVRRVLERDPALARVSAVHRSAWLG
jgi:HD domain-containing protein